jgi:hypothetical protein
MTPSSGRAPSGQALAVPAEPSSTVSALTGFDPSRKVLAGLSMAQRRALAGLPIKRDFRPSLTGFQWSTLACLKSKRLINSVVDGIRGCGPDAMHRVTPFGLRVRTLIEGQSDEL